LKILVIICYSAVWKKKTKNEKGEPEAVGINRACLTPGFKFRKRIQKIKKKPGVVFGTNYNIYIYATDQVIGRIKSLNMHDAFFRI
jgi:hypothetical protein